MIFGRRKVTREVERKRIAAERLRSMQDALQAIGANPSAAFYVLGYMDHRDKTLKGGTA